jgi:hypothetical protein
MVADRLGRRRNIGDRHRVQGPDMEVLRMHRSPARGPFTTRRIATLAGILAVAAGACTGGASTAPSIAPGGSPTAAPGTLVLERVPDSTACDAIGVDYTSVTFRIDVTATPQVWAVADTGTSLLVRWSGAFAAGTGTVPTVVDGSGTVVLEDGETMDLPEGGWPDLHGHIVCPGPSSLTVLEVAPAG